MSDQGAADGTETVSAGAIYVGFWARFVAFLIDSTVATLILAPVSARVMDEIVVADYDLGDRAELILLLQRLTAQLSFDLLLMGTVFVLFWVFKNATPGKMLFRCVIVDATTLARPSTFQNIVRYLCYYVSLIPFGLGFLWIGLDSKKQGWHDKISRTVVIKGRPRETRSA